MSLVLAAQHQVRSSEIVGIFFTLIRVSVIRNSASHKMEEYRVQKSPPERVCARITDIAGVS